ncbi:MAG: carbon-nitrogen hydrolase family protein [Planctomycetota bacterium]
MKRLAMLTVLLLVGPVASAEDIARESFEGPARNEPLVRTWGDEPTTISTNATVPAVGLDGTAAACLRLEFPDETPHNLSYWQYNLSEPVPLVPELESISFQVKTNVPVSIKIAISPYGFIYHGPGVSPSDEWQKVTLADAYTALKKWCEGGERTAEGGFVSGVIVAVGGTRGAKAEVTVDEIALEGPTGAVKALAEEAFRRRTKKVRIVPISLVWDQGHRTLENTLRALDEAGLAGADMACLPECCVDQPPEPIPGPTAEKIAAKAAQYKMYVVGNLRERDGEETYVTSFLCDREGGIVGKYRKSHRLPYEAGPAPGAGFALGDDLPVFQTDFGPVGLKIGTDHYFPEIDGVLRRRGARLIVWSTSPFPVRDEHTITLSLKGRAVDNRVYYAVARYAGPFTEHTRLRDYHRTVDDGYFFVRATSQTGQTDHRAYVMDPWGMPLGASQFRTNNEPVVVTLQLDNRPPYYEWPEEILRAGPYPDPYKSGKRPVAKGDLRSVVLAERRPELYRPRPEPEQE